MLTCRSANSPLGARAASTTWQSSLSHELKAGQDYSEAKPVIAIHLIDFEVFHADGSQRGQPHWRFEFRDPRQSAVRFGDQLD